MKGDTLHIRPNYIDYAKVIGICCIMFVHWMYISGIEIKPSPILCCSHIVELFAVPLFFIISGFLYKGCLNAKDEALKIWKTLVVPYLIICAIGVIVGGLCFLSEGTLTITMICKMCANILTGFDFGIGRYDLCSPLWFVYALVIVKLTYIWVQKNKFVVIALSIFSIILMHVGNVLPFTLDSAVVGLMFFSIGYYGKSLIEQIMEFSLYKKVIISVICIATLIAVGYFSDDFNSIGVMSMRYMKYGKYPILFLFSSVAGTIIVFYICNMLAGTHMFSHIVLGISTGLILVLGIHKWIYKLLLLLPLRISSHLMLFDMVYTILACLMCYIFILLSMKYFPLLIGGRSYNVQKI